MGAVRGQLIPCDASIQLEDVSAELTSEDAAVFRRVVGMCLYLSRDRPDIIFPVKEVSGKMSRPTLTSLQHLRKLIGYLKKMGDLEFCCSTLNLELENGVLQQRSSGFWNPTVMLTGHRTKPIESPQAVEYTFSTGASYLHHREPRELFPCLPANPNCTASCRP